MTGSGNTLLDILWTGLASFAGALTALSFRPFKDMTGWEIALAIFVGASFAFFMGPWVARWVFGGGPTDMKVMGGLLYLLGTGSNVLIPLAVKKLSSFFGVNGNGEGKAK